ncbi:MAG: DUF423 domain-containing protein [Halobacteriovoraceae bacterium]|nr:DUF423 domain-containing protein [Halobacteriovoraceae bacterium]
MLFLAVMIGAFGAHGLKGKISDLALETYHTGVFYHFIHAIGIFVISLFSLITKRSFKLALLFHATGIILFSFFCYAYAISGIKLFAMIVPLGGTSFLIGWLVFTVKCLRIKF